MGKVEQGFLDVCPTACTTFALTVMNNPCSAPVVASLAPNVTAMMETAEATIETISNGLCSNTCLQGTIAPLVDLVPQCYKTVLASDRLIVERLTARLSPSTPPPPPFPPSPPPTPSPPPSPP